MRFPHTVTKNAIIQLDNQLGGSYRRKRDKFGAEIVCESPVPVTCLISMDTYFVVVSYLDGEAHIARLTMEIVVGASDAANAATSAVELAFVLVVEQVANQASVLGDKKRFKKGILSIFNIFTLPKFTPQNVQDFPTVWRVLQRTQMTSLTPRRLST